MMGVDGVLRKQSKPAEAEVVGNLEQRVAEGGLKYHVSSSEDRVRPPMPPSTRCLKSTCSPQNSKIFRGWPGGADVKAGAF